jgi:hypothetical protein
VTSAHPKDSTILASVAQAAFVRDIATDANTWSDHASAVFADIAPALLASGAGFQGRLSRMIEPTPSIRSDARAHSPPARRRPYRIEYGVRSSMSEPVLWIEETVAGSIQDLNDLRGFVTR